MQFLVASTSLALLSLSSSSFLLTTEAAAAVGFVCQDFFQTATGESETICASAFITSPSPAADEDGNVTYIGDWTMEWSILDTGNVTASDLSDEELSQLPMNGEVIQFNRNGETDECTIQLNGELCSGCTFCGDEDDPFDSVSTDCTNVAGGRNVPCEPLEEIFYPVEGYSRLEAGGEVEGDGPSDGGEEEDDSSSAITAFASLAFGISAVLAAMV